MKEAINLYWRPMAMMLTVLVCFSIVSAPAVTMAQEAPVTEEVAADEVVTEQASTDETSQESASKEPVVATPITAEFMVNNLWIMIAGMLVFIMHLGFAALESGLTRSKNTVNILFKNSMIVCIGIITYGICGFNLMYPGFDGEGTTTVDAQGVEDTTYKVPDSSFIDGYVGFAGFGFLTNGPEVAAEPDEPTLKDGATAEEKKEYDAAVEAYPAQLKAYNDSSTPTYSAGYTIYTDFFFQAMFAATCCTIVSGAVAGRVKLSTFLVFCTLFVSISYPITGSWQWGAGWLARAGFYDFAGSTLVHSVGGWGALVMAILLGPRLGKYVNGRAVAISPSNLPMAAIGVFLLWFGWFGFNGGSVLDASPGKVSLVLVTTSMAAAAGGFAAAMTSWVHSGKPDLSMSLNGILAGLVGITAGADLMSGLDAIIIGAIAGVLVYFVVIFIDSVLKIDDPVGAISVHLVCGIWGTLAVGLFGAEAGMEQLGSQLIGIVAIGVFTVAFCLIVGLALKFTMGLRVDAEEEQRGLDLGEHGISAYSLN